MEILALCSVSFTATRLLCYAAGSRSAGPIRLFLSGLDLLDLHGAGRDILETLMVQEHGNGVLTLDGCCIPLIVFNAHSLIDCLHFQAMRCSLDDDTAKVGYHNLLRFMQATADEECCTGFLQIA